MSVVLPTAPAGRAVHLVVPEGVDDPGRPSGGNAYDRRVRRELRRQGVAVHQHEAAGAWPRPSQRALESFSRLVGSFEDGACLLVDGLVASAAEQALVPHLGRLRVVVLVHLPLGVDDAAAREAEGALFRAVAGLVTTSAWCRDWVAGHYRVPTDRVTVAKPGVDPAPPAAGSGPGSDGGELLCVAAVTPGKGHDVLLEALTRLGDPGGSGPGGSGPGWRLTCVGPLDRSPDFAARVRQLADRAAPGRVRFTGPLAEDALDEAFSRADLLVLPSRVETYGMVVTEALARGIPVVASRVGGVPEALGCAAPSPLRGPEGGTGGVLVPGGDPDALAAALRAWLTDPGHRARLRAAARSHRRRLPGWDVTAAQVAAALDDARRDDTGRDDARRDDTRPGEPNRLRSRSRRVEDGELSYPTGSLSAGPPSAGAPSAGPRSARAVDRGARRGTHAGRVRRGERSVRGTEG